MVGLEREQSAKQERFGIERDERHDYERLMRHAERTFGDVAFRSRDAHRGLEDVLIVYASRSVDIQKAGSYERDHATSIFDHKHPQVRCWLFLGR
jgi:hypothetical protein